MGTVFKKTVTRPLPQGAELFTKQGQQFAKWKPTKGRARTAKVTIGKDGSTRILDEAGTYTAKYRDGEGIVCEVSTGCRDEDAARSVLSKLERRAELIRSEVISPAEAATADHQRTPIADHFAAYLNHVRAKGATGAHIADLKRKAERLFNDCFATLRDIDAEKLESWLNSRQAEGTSARTRNAYLQAVRGFCKWCVQSERLSTNPLVRIAKADEKGDRRRQRRSMTEAELVMLLQVARMRPLAEYGRETSRPDDDDADAKGNPPKRSKWKKAVLTLDTMPAVAERAKERLADNPEFVEKLERLGRERALIYKMLLLTGLRRGELASLTVGQVELDGPMPFVELKAADEKNGKGSTIPIRADLANDLKDWLSNVPKPSTLRLRNNKGTCDSKRPLFTVPKGLVRILDRDLRTAGIAKRDERGRTIDVHALRHTFGTLLSKGGVAPRTAQAALRHSKIDLTMNIYTDPRLLDTHGALDTLPSLNLDSPPSAERAVMRATGTDDRNAAANRRRVESAGATGKSFVAPDVAPTLGNSGQSVSFAVISSDVADERASRRVTHENPSETNKKALSAVFADKAFKVEDNGVEPMTSCMPCKRSPN
jgi:integrase